MRLILEISKEELEEYKKGADPEMTDEEAVEGLIEIMCEDKPIDYLDWKDIRII